MNKLEYTHIPVNRDVVCIAGYYTPLKEARLRYNDREVLYVVGLAVLESSCCGTGRWGYALVPGYVVGWQNQTNEAGLPVSDVEPISDKIAQDDISRTLKEVESISQVEFW
jgi:hypothetical protein